MRLVFSALLLFLAAACSDAMLETISAPELTLPMVISVSPSKDNTELLQAIEEAKQYRKEGRAVEVRLQSGIYYLEHPIYLDSEFSGTDETPFILASKDDDPVVLSAGRPLELDWTEHSEGVLKAALVSGPIDQLYINGTRQIRARYPNFDPAISVFNGFAKDVINLDRISHWQNPVGGYIHSLHKARWGGMHHEIVGLDSEGQMILNGGFQNNRASPMHEKYRYVENIFEELDAPGEWFYSESESILYFYPESGLNLGTATVEVSNLPHVIEIRGESDAPVKNIRIEGLEFVHTAMTFMETREQLLRSDWAIYRGGAILVEHAENIEILDSDFHSLGGNAIFVSNYNRNIEIAGNHIYDVGASAIAFVGSSDAVRSPSFEYNEFVSIEAMDFEPGPKTENYPALSSARDNLIHDIGWVEKQVAGVQIAMASDITVAHNSIYRVPRAGINISEGTWGGHLLEYNDVFDTVLETGDHGAFNSWGRDRFWHPDREVMEQITEDKPRMWELDAQNPTIIRNSRWQCDHGWDIDLDDGSSNYKIYNNLMLNGGLKLREGFKRIATNNIILNNSFHPHVWFKNSEDVFSHNLVTASHKPILNDEWGDEVDYNFFATRDGLNKAQALGLDQHSMVFEPSFLDPEHGDYRLPADSVAVVGGFKNFPMDQFGVKSERLKALAEQPDFPELFLDSEKGSAGKTLGLFGAELKNIETLGEQSALGAVDMNGAMVMTILPKSIAAREGLQVRDLVLKVQDLTFGGEDEIRNINDLLNSYQSRKWRGVLEVIVLRNQQELSLSINLLE